MARSHAASQLRTIRTNVAVAVSLCLLLGVVGGWASTAQISGAVIANGRVVVESNVKKVQHPLGGVVREVLVDNGSAVQAGQLLLRLDDTVANANRTIAENTLIELYTRRARLEAERDDAGKLDWPVELLMRRTIPLYSDAMRAEERLFELRRLARNGQKAQLQERVHQAEQQIAGLEGQVASKANELRFITHEIGALRDLFQKQLVPLTRVTTLERDAVRIRGERGSLLAEVASTKGRIAETKLQILQIDQDLRSTVAKELQEVYAKIAEAIERRVTAEDQLKRTAIRAPQDGIVHELTVHGMGGVIAQGAPIMLIVPSQDTLLIEARIEPQIIDRTRVGHQVLFRFTSFNEVATPELSGEVAYVSPDTARDVRTGRSYYTVRMTLNPGEIQKLGSPRLVPGMPVEAFIKTEDRSVLAFLVKPLADQITHTHRRD